MFDEALDIIEHTHQTAFTEIAEPRPRSDDEAEHEYPNEGWDLKLAVALDHAEFLGVLFKKLRGK